MYISILYIPYIPYIPHNCSVLNARTAFSRLSAISGNLATAWLGGTDRATVRSFTAWQASTCGEFMTKDGDYIDMSC